MRGTPRIADGMGITPIPADPLRRAELRQRLADAAESIIALLDAIDDDAEGEDGGDAEPSLGWTHTMAWGSTDDDEEPLSIVPVEREASPAAARARAGDALEARTERNAP